MTDARVYFRELRELCLKIERRFGVPPGPQRDLHVSDLAGLAVSAVIIKTLTDQGVITNAQLQATVAAARAELWVLTDAVVIEDPDPGEIVSEIRCTMSAEGETGS